MPRVSTKRLVSTERIGIANSSGPNAGTWNSAAPTLTGTYSFRGDEYSCLHKMRFGSAIHEVGSREMLFPDQWVIIPCSVRLKNRDGVVETRVCST